MYIDTEGMQRAANTMHSAAKEMQTAVGYLSNELQRQREFMDDWLFRYQSILEYQANKFDQPFINSNLDDEIPF